MACIPSRFCVVLHDVSPVFTQEVNQILEGVGKLVGRNIGAAIVPCWHGIEPDPTGIQQFRDWKLRFGELLLHGWTHFRHHAPGVISLVTGRADEFGGMTAAESTERLKMAQSRVREFLGCSVSGFVPPAWQFPAPITALQAAGLDYRLGFHRLKSVGGACIPLATWSWDWGRLYGTRRPGAWLGAIQQAWCPAAVPIITLHPVDVRRRCLPSAVRLVERLLQRGLEPVLPSTLLQEHER